MLRKKPGEFQNPNTNDAIPFGSIIPYLSTFVVFHVILIAVLVGETKPLDTQLGLKGSRGVVDTSMDHTAVVSALMGR